MDIAAFKQHLIDPEICIRCNTCESVCPVKAISHDDRNYVVDADKCQQCMACVPPCPTGAIDNWHLVPRARAYTLAEQFGWDVLPEPLTAAQLAEAGVGADARPGVADAALLPTATATAAISSPDASSFDSSAYGATLPPWSRRPIATTSNTTSASAVVATVAARAASSLPSTRA